MEPEMLLAFIQVFATEHCCPASSILFLKDPFKYHISVYVYVSHAVPFLTLAIPPLSQDLELIRNKWNQDFQPC